MSSYKKVLVYRFFNIFVHPIVASIVGSIRPKHLQVDAKTNFQNSVTFGQLHLFRSDFVWNEYKIQN